MFKLSSEQFSETQRTQVLNALGDRLGEIIQDDDQLANLFKLPSEQLNETQRTQILNAFGERLGEVIPYGYQFLELLDLSPKKLSGALQTQIWSAVKKQTGKDPGVFIMNQYFSPRVKIRVELQQYYDKIENHIIELQYHCEHINQTSSLRLDIHQCKDELYSIIAEYRKNHSDHVPDAFKDTFQNKLNDYKKLFTQKHHDIPPAIPGEI